MGNGRGGRPHACRFTGGRRVIKIARLAMRDPVLGHALAHQPHGAQPRGPRGGELAPVVGEERDCVRRRAHRCRNRPIGGWIGFHAGGGIEEAVEKQREIAVRGVAEDQALGEDRAGRVNVQPDVARLPRLELRRHVGVEVARDLVARIAALPDKPWSVLSGVILRSSSIQAGSCAMVSSTVSTWPACRSISASACCTSGSAERSRINPGRCART